MFLKPVCDRLGDMVAQPYTEQPTIPPMVESSTSIITEARNLEFLILLFVLCRWILRAWSNEPLHGSKRFSGRKSKQSLTFKEILCR